MPAVSTRVPTRTWPGCLALGAYAWLYAAMLGLVVLDILYARALGALPRPAEFAGIFNEISDLLIFPYALLMLSGALALGLAWRDLGPRRLIQASLALPVLALVGALMLGPALGAAGLGTWIRLGASLAGSILGMLALIRFLARQTT